MINAVPPVVSVNGEQRKQMATGFIENRSTGAVTSFGKKVIVGSTPTFSTSAESKYYPWAFSGSLTISVPPSCRSTGLVYTCRI